MYALNWQKTLAIAQSACQPQPILAKTLDASSYHICWDISKRKKKWLGSGPIGSTFWRIFQYLLKYGVLKFFERAVGPPSRCPWLRVLWVSIFEIWWVSCAVDYFSFNWPWCVGKSKVSSHHPKGCIDTLVQTHDSICEVEM